MKIWIGVFNSCFLVTVGRGMPHREFDWIQVLDYIRDDDIVVVANWTGIVVEK